MINIEPNKIEVTVNDPYVTERLRDAITKDSVLEDYIRHAVKMEVRGKYMNSNYEWRDNEPDYIVALIKLPVFPVRKKVKKED